MDPDAYRGSYSPSPSGAQLFLLRQGLAPARRDLGPAGNKHFLCPLSRTDKQMEGARRGGLLRRHRNSQASEKRDRTYQSSSATFAAQNQWFPGSPSAGVYGSTLTEDQGAYLEEYSVQPMPAGSSSSFQVAQSAPLRVLESVWEQPTTSTGETGDSAALYEEPEDIPDPTYSRRRRGKR
jgi:hypothetical protein